MMTRVAIIGTAGRREDGPKMTKALYESMVSYSHRFIGNLCQGDYKQVQLASGGAAWADHVAVTLFLTKKYGGLTLYLPAGLSISGESYFSKKHNDPASTSNYYHEQFSQKIGHNSILDIYDTYSLGAQFLINEKGFHARNKDLAKNCDVMLAFTWGESDSEPKDGGTKHTWDHCICTKYHVPLYKLQAEVTNEQQENK